MVFRKMLNHLHNWPYDMPPYYHQVKRYLCHDTDEIVTAFYVINRTLPSKLFLFSCTLCEILFVETVFASPFVTPKTMEFHYVYWPTPNRIYNQKCMEKKNQNKNCFNSLLMDVFVFIFVVVLLLSSLTLENVSILYLWISYLQRKIFCFFSYFPTGSCLIKCSTMISLWNYYGMFEMQH